MASPDNRVISLTYELFVNGKLVEKTETEKPFSFLTGAGNVLPKFEENLVQFKKDEDFDFSLTADQAYGAVKSEAIVNVPMSAFEINGKTDETMLVPGHNIPMQDTAGNRLNGLVVEVEPEHVRMDFNHPLAGNDLRFKGKILEIRNATEDELQHGHVHDEHSCENCDDPDCCQKN